MTPEELPEVDVGSDLDLKIKNETLKRSNASVEEFIFIPSLGIFELEFV